METSWHADSWITTDRGHSAELAECVRQFELRQRVSGPLPELRLTEYYPPSPVRPRNEPEEAHRSGQLQANASHATFRRTSLVFPLKRERCYFINLHTNAEGLPANSAELRNDLNWTIFAPVANFWGAILQVVIAAATPTMINSRRFDVVARLFFVLLTMIFPTWTWSQQTASTPQDYVPVELQASSPEVKVYLDTAEKLSREGSYSESFQQLKKALDLCTNKGLVADKPLIEAKLGAASFVQGKLDDAKEYWVHSLSDSQSVSNLVLQADVLVAISSMAQSAGNPIEALDLLTKALDLARKSKNLFIQSRCLGELGRLRLTQGKEKKRGLQ